MKTACTVQCPQCPFRPTSLPSYLGDYTVDTVIAAVQHNQPFFCHTQIDYARGRAMETAAVKGKLCRGSLAFAAKLNAPLLNGDEAVAIARTRLKTHDGVECMEPAVFREHHDPSKTAVNLRKLPTIASGSSTGIERDGSGEPTEAEIAAELRALDSLRSRIVPRTMFGDDNLARLEAVITVLEERLDEGECFDRWGLLNEDDEENGEENAEANEADGRSDDLAGAAAEAAQWLAGDSSESPSAGWPLKADSP